MQAMSSHKLQKQSGGDSNWLHAGTVYGACNNAVLNAEICIFLQVINHTGFLLQGYELRVDYR